MRFPALNSREFVIFTAGNFAAMNAVWINRVVIGWLGWELTGLASWVGLLSFMLFAPTLIASPLFGVILDRVDIRRAAMLSQVVLIGAMAVLLVLLLAGLLNIWLLSFVALVIGITATADRTVRFVLVPAIVEKNAIANAITIHGINFNVARLLGPAFGGLMLSAIGSDVTVAVNILMIVPFLAVLFTLNIRPRETPLKPRQSFMAEIVDGARYAWRHPIIREALATTAIYALTVRGALEILPAIADGEFHRGPEGLAIMLTAAGAGALVAAVFVAFRRSGAPVAGPSIPAYVAIGVGIGATVALGLTGSWPVAVGVVAVLGYAATASAIDIQTTVQISLDETYRGRVMGLWIMLVLGGTAMNSIALGFFADLVGMTLTLLGAAILAAFAFGWCMVAAVRWRREPLPGP